MADESGSSSGKSSDSNSQKQQKNQSSKKNKRGGKNRNRRGRRRYFRRKKGEDGQSGDNSKSGGESGDNKSQSTEEKRRRARRNRRRRKSGKSKRSNNKGPSIIEQIDNNYVPPESVYVYTHVLRPVDTMDSYEYRPDHFSSTDRSLGDFRIDLSSLFGDDDSPDAPIQLKISQPLDYSIFDDDGEEENGADAETADNQLASAPEETKHDGPGDAPTGGEAG